MRALLDTSIAIHLANGHPGVTARVSEVVRAPFLSVVSRIELEAGVYAVPGEEGERRTRVNVLTGTMSELAFTGREVAAYAGIITACGFSRRLVVDRMIAATALTHDLTLVTSNGKDFRSVPGLKLEVWPASPA